MINHWMFKCSEVTRLISKSMDQKLPISQRIGIRIHLAMCRYCSLYKKQLELLRKIIAQVVLTEDTIVSPLNLSPQARLRMKQVLSGQAK